MANTVKGSAKEAWSGLTPATRNLIIWVIVIILIIILIKNRYRIAKIFEAKAPNRGVEEQLEQPVLDSRKQIIEGLASSLNNDINNTGWSHDYPLYSQALGLADNELIYLAKYYRQNLSPSESLYDAIEGEYYTWDWSYETTPWQLQDKLADLGQR